MTSGRMKEPASDDLLRLLIDDLSQYPEPWVLRAISDHRKSSPWWPSLADLVKHMQPSIDSRQRSEAFEANRRQSRAFVSSGGGGGKESTLSIEERKAIVLEALGYDPADRRGIQKAGRIQQFQKECEDRGIEPSDVSLMSEKQVLDAFVDKRKPWNNPAELKASARRIAKYMETQDPDWMGAP